VIHVSIRTSFLREEDPEIVGMPEVQKILREEWHPEWMLKQRTPPQKRREGEPRQIPSV